MTTLNGKTIVKAGLIAGIVFMALEMGLVATVGGGSAWGPPRMIGAMVLGEGVLPPPGTFALVPVMTAMVIHFLLSIVYAAILGWIIAKWRLGTAAAAIVGLVFGLAIYLVNFYGFTAVWPWFAMARNWISVLAHAVYGLVLGLSLAAMARPGDLRRA